jgi:rhamnulokinase
MAYYFALDLGAESGRAILGELEPDARVLSTREIHRFANDPVDYGGSLHWDAPRLWFELQAALAAAGEVSLAAIGVDTWGVDYALLGEHGDLIRNPYHYRDTQNVAAMHDLLTVIGKDELYKASGIQLMSINTLIQLHAARTRAPRLLDAADRLVMMPDLFNYWLTGTAVCEFTNATTTQLIDPHKRTWNTSLMDRLDLPARLLSPVVEAGSVIGSFKSTPVVASATHDTAAAFAAAAGSPGAAFISSGTWSLVGIELPSPIISDASFRLNFSNEGGVCGTTRFLKNVMGLWMLQGCRKAWADAGRAFTYAELMDAAEREPAAAQLIDPDDPSFLRPDSMTKAIDDFCTRTDQPSPSTPGAYARTVVDSLALKYRLVIDQIEAVTGRSIESVRIVGGGSKNRLLNQLTADATGRPVVAGPVEATALGNIAVQMMATGAAESLSDTRAIIERSFPSETFEPRDTEPWTRAAARFHQYCSMTYA